MKTNHIITASLVGITACTGAVLASSTIYADNDSAVDQITITVPTACTMSGSVVTGQEHSAELTPGTYSGASGSTYENGIGKTTLTTYCNDYNGFSIYAVGYTADTLGNNTLAGTTASGNSTIASGVYTTGDTSSSWSMKVTKVTDSTTSFNPNNMTIDNSFSTWHAVPDTYTRVVYYQAATGSSATDNGANALGAKVETTYAAYISTTQPADTYTGQVKYVMVHPYSSEDPDPYAPAMPPDPISQCTTQVPGVTYMQDITSSNLATVLSNMEMNQQYYLRDKRDETPYCVAKLDDGSQTGTLWMTQNLRIQGTISAELSNFEGADFNVSEYDLKTDGISGSECNYNSGTATGGFYHVCSHTPEFTEIPSGKTVEDVGAWYNYMAATAGAISGISNYVEATSDICPTGWHMPNYDTNNTAGSINSISNASLAETKTAFSPVAGGYYTGGVISNAGSGYWWSTMTDSNNYRYRISFGGSSLSTSLNYRYHGLYIRCTHTAE